MSDIYSGTWLRRWVMVDGWPRCPETALDLATADEGAIAGVMAGNAAVRAAGAAAEEYEAAARVIAGREPPVEDEAAWQDRAAAQAVIDAAGPDLCRLVRTRAGLLELEEEDAWTLRLPPLPGELDPRAETAEWVSGTWVVRSMTSEELAAHPLRPAPAMGKMAFGALLTDTLGAERAAVVLARFAAVLALATDARFIDVFDAIDGDPARPGYAVQLTAAGEVTEAEVASLRAGWPRARRG